MTDFSNINLVSQPKNMKVALFPHQLASIYKMENLEINNVLEKENYVKETKIGVNADLTGFGKTLSMLGLISRDKMEWDLEIPFVFETITIESKGRIKNYYISRYDKLPTTLILVSQSLIGQWVKEIAKTTMTYKSVTTRKDIDNIEVENYDIVIVSPTLYNKLISKYNGYAWKRFIFDEPGHLKVSAMKEIHAGFYWFVTATPNGILYQHRNCRNSFIKDLFCQYYYMDFETQFNDIIIKNDSDFVKASFEMPVTNHHVYECFQPVYNAVNGFVNATIATMIEAGNIEGAIEALGGNKTGNIIELVKNKKLEDLEEIESKIRIYTMRNDQTKIDEWNNKKIHTLNQIEELNNRFKTMLENPCNICFDTIKSPILEPNCQNIFCGECLLKWLQRKNSCPLCRAEVDLSSLIYLENESRMQIVQPKERKMTKDEKIVEIIKNNEEGMFLIFSEYDHTFYQIYKILYENDINFIEIKGSIKTREKNLDLFRAGKIKVIFLNSNYNGAGINLIEATDIILYHEMMNSCAENQILGRANRIGRTKPLNVHHLIIS